MASVFSKTSIIYHDIFNYPLDRSELKTWYTPIKIKTSKLKVMSKNNFYFLQGRSEIIEKRLENERYSKRKIKIAKKAADLISKIPSVLFVGITGSLAMRNASKDSDIDLMIITKKNRLWTTRLLVYMLLFLTGYKIRRPNDSNEKDKLCINMWLDVESISWPRKERNIYTAHEILQINPLLDKDSIYNLFIFKNSWALRYWPKVAKLPFDKSFLGSMGSNLFKSNNSKTLEGALVYIERILFHIQYAYMKNKITSEVIFSDRAVFHPKDWSRLVINRLYRNKLR